MKRASFPKGLTVKLFGLIMAAVVLYGCMPRADVHTIPQELTAEAEVQEPKIFHAGVKPREEREAEKAAEQESQQQTQQQSAEQLDSTHTPTQQSQVQSQTQSKPQEQAEQAQKPAVQQPVQGAGADAGEYVVGYYASWGANAGVPADSLDGDKLTHINYAFATIDSGMKVAMAQPAADRENFAALRRLKEEYPHLRTLISVGGWGYSGRFSDAAATAANREKFAQSCVDFILEHGFDGVDLDWEFPVSGGMAGNSNRPADKQNFTLLLQAVRDKLDEQSAKDGREYLLTIAGGAGSSYLAKIEPQKVAAIVDYIFIMGYDMHGTWDTYADLNAPLYTPTEDSPQYKISVADSVQVYLDSGIPASKLVLGMPFYGYRYTTSGGLYGRFGSAESVSYRTLKNKYLNDDSFEYFWHEDAQVPYLVSGNSFISYDDVKSIARKTAFARNHGLAGVGMWELSQDSRGELLDAAYQALR